MATQLSSEDTFTLTEIGYASVMYGININVEPIFKTLNLLYPDNTAGAIGHAIIYLNRGNYDAAIDVLQNCLQQCSTNTCLLYTSPSPRDRQKSRMPSSA